MTSATASFSASSALAGASGRTCYTLSQVGMATLAGMSTTGKPARHVWLLQALLLYAPALAQGNKLTRASDITKGAKTGAAICMELGGVEEVRARWPCSVLQRMRYTSPTLPNRKRSGVSTTPSPKSDRRAYRPPAAQLAILMKYAPTFVGIFKQSILMPDSLAAHI